MSALLSTPRLVMPLRWNAFFLMIQRYRHSPIESQVKQYRFRLIFFGGGIGLLLEGQSLGHAQELSGALGAPETVMNKVTINSCA
jgi:hypothetical protein